MKSLKFFALLLLSSSVSAEVGDVKLVPLGNGFVLRLEEIAPSRIIPYAYYDQAMESIPAIHPDAQIITKRRMGKFGDKSKLFYSLVSYKESNNAKEVIIGGNIRYKKKAWSFSAIVSDESYSDSLVLVLEHIAVLAYLNNSLQRTPKNRRR